MTQLTVPLDFVTDQYKQHYTPPSTYVTLTLPLTQFDDPPIQINPWGFASISTLYRTIPTPEHDTFEINKQEDLETIHDLICFLNMCRNSIPVLCNEEVYKTLRKLDHGKWCNHNTFYAASRLCDYLGIEAASVIAAYPGFSHPFGDALHNSLERKVLFHQIALKFNNAAGLRDIPVLLANAYIGSLQPKPAVLTETQMQNYRILVLQLLYHTFGGISPLKAAHKSFFIEKLGWHAGDNIHLGYRIRLPEDSA